MIDAVKLLIARDFLLESGWEPAQDTLINVTGWLDADDQLLKMHFPYYIGRSDIPWLSPAMAEALRRFGLEIDRDWNSGKINSPSYEPMEPEFKYIDPLEREA